MGCAICYSTNFPQKPGERASSSGARARRLGRPGRSGPGQPRRRRAGRPHRPPKWAPKTRKGGQGHSHSADFQHLRHATRFICQKMLVPGEGGEQAWGSRDGQNRNWELRGPGGGVGHSHPMRSPTTTPCLGASICWSEDYEEATYAAKLLRPQTWNKSSGPLLAATSPSRASVLHYRECSLAHSKKY